jgi:hypothetical protein
MNANLFERLERSMANPTKTAIAAPAVEAARSSSRPQPDRVFLVPGWEAQHLRELRHAKADCELG